MKDKELEPWELRNRSTETHATLAGVYIRKDYFSAVNFEKNINR
jgi:hypothetical protein